MMNKTLRKLLKKESKKPLHCIDTNVFLESMLDTDLGEICIKHLNNMGKGKYYRGVFPISVLGEIVMVTLRDLHEPNDRRAVLDHLERIARIGSIAFVAPKQEDYILISELKEADSRLEDTDAQHLVSAKRAGAITFLTFDTKLLENKALESRLGLKIKHPKEFVKISA